MDSGKNWIFVLTVLSYCLRALYGQFETTVVPVTKSMPFVDCMNSTDIVEMLQLNNVSFYNRHRMPKSSGNDVLEEVWIQEITRISEITSDFEIDIYMNEIWVDHRLSYSHMNPCKPNVSVDHTIYDQIWTPNTCFVNSKQADIHESPFRNIYIMIYPDGTIWINYRVKLTGPCHMDLRNFPMDTQQCKLQFLSFNYNNDEVRMRWKTNEILVLGSTELPDFSLIKTDTIHREEFYPGGYWDEMWVVFTFKRRYGWYILQAYIPTYLTIFISWISFYLGAKSIPARTMIGVNSLLAMSFQFGSILRNLPRVSYVKAIDVWMLNGMTFVFGSLLELAVVGYLSRDVEPSRKSKPRESTSRDFWSPTPAVPIDAPTATTDFSPGEPIGPDGTVQRFRFAAMEAKNLRCSWTCTCIHCKLWKPDRIDRFSAIMFPTLFFVFNIFYWGYCLSAANEPLNN